MNYKLVIGWLYPDLMSTYGDRGNIICLAKRCEWRGIEAKIVPIEPTTENHEIITLDLIFGGGAQDREQEIVMRDLHKKKGSLLKQKIENNIPALFVCGSPQLMGRFYEPAEGERINGLGIFDIETKHPGKHVERCIGNVLAEVQWANVSTQDTIPVAKTIVGFENHGGRTYLIKNAKPFAHVLVGNGNNGKDKTEGVIHKNAVGCYFHGPLLPKNPHIADWLIDTAVFVKYKEKLSPPELDDRLEWDAHNAIARRLRAGV